MTGRAECMECARVLRVTLADCSERRERGEAYRRMRESCKRGQANCKLNSDAPAPKPELVCD